MILIYLTVYSNLLDLKWLYKSTEDCCIWTISKLNRKCRVERRSNSQFMRLEFLPNNFDHPKKCYYIDTTNNDKFLIAQYS